MEYITKQEQKRQLERILRRHRSQQIPRPSFFFGGEDYGAKHRANEREIIDAIERLAEDRVSPALERLVNESIEISITRENEKYFEEIIENYMKYIMMLHLPRLCFSMEATKKNIEFLEETWKNLFIIHRSLVGFANYFLKVENQSDYHILLSMLEQTSKTSKSILGEELNRTFCTDYNVSAFYIYSDLSNLRLEYDCLEFITRLYHILLERHDQKWGSSSC